MFAFLIQRVPMRSGSISYQVKQLVVMGCVAFVAAGCGGNEPPTPPPPPTEVWILQPQDGDILAPGETVQIQFQGASFTGIQQFEVKTSDSQVWYVGPSSTGSGGAQYGTMFFGESTWTPDSPGIYTIQVRATNAALQSSSWVEIHVVVMDYSAAPGVVENPGVIEFGPSPTPTGIFIKIEAVMNANCRAGPGTVFNETGFIPKGSSVQVVGRNEDETWVNVVNLNGDGFCWASVIAFDIPFGLIGLPVVASDPAPAPPSSGGGGGGGGGGPKLQGCMVTNPLNGQQKCEYPCPPGAVPGPACTP